MRNFEGDTLDLRGLSCPENATRAMFALELMDPGELLEIPVDVGEPCSNVAHILEHEEHIILERELGDWGRLLVERGE